MPSDPKEWLVRTRSGDVLGPFTQRELKEGLERGAFLPEDEIARSQGNWFSATVLSQRDLEEVTSTSTRSQTFAKAPPAAAPVFTQTAVASPDSESDTVQPKTTVPRVESSQESTRKQPLHLVRSSSFPHRVVGPFLSTLIVVIIVWAVLLQVRPKEKVDLTIASTPLPAEGESSFTKQIYSWIGEGEKARALKELTLYHERNAIQSEVEYLIPYAALLITEKESKTRAKKFLETVLVSKASAPLKSKAHHWLGYLLLNDEQGDMGESHFLEALQLNPKDPAARFNLGRAYLKQERFSQALDYLQLSELEVPDLWLVHIYKGRARVALGNLNEAQISFRAAVQAAPDRWLSYIYDALFLTRAKEYVTAQNVLKEMLTRDPHYEIQSPAPFGFYQERGNYAEYLNAYQEVMKRSGGSQKEVGKLYLDYLQNRLAGNEERKVESLAAKDDTAKILALKIVLDRNGNSEAIKNALGRLEEQLTPLGYYGLVLTAEAKYRMGRLDDAEQDLKKALSLDPRAAVTRLAIARLLKLTGKTQESQIELRRLLQFHPLYIPALRQAVGEFDKACLLCGSK